MAYSVTVLYKMMKHPDDDNGENPLPCQWYIPAIYVSIIETEHSLIR
jgi:hypothetical protein